MHKSFEDAVDHNMRRMDMWGAVIAGAALLALIVGAVVAWRR